MRTLRFSRASTLAAFPSAGLMLVLLGSCFGCGWNDSPAPAFPDETRTEAVSKARAALETTSRRPVQKTPQNIGSNLPEPPWPSSWRMLDRGTVGSKNFPLAWYRFDAGAISPEEAVTTVLLAIETLDQRWILNEVSPAADGETAIGQALSTTVRMTIKARRNGGDTVVRVHIEPPT